MDPHHNLTHDNMVFLWEIMTEWTRANDPAQDTKDIQLNFTAFLHGMAEVNKHPECGGWLDVSKVGCTWSVYSLN